jgi:hypothetical protein
MASGIFVNDSGRILVSLFFWIGKRVTTLLPIFLYHKLAQSLLTMGLARVVTPPGATAIIVSIIDALVGANLRQKDLSCDHQSSIGLKSGE